MNSLSLTLKLRKPLIINNYGVGNRHKYASLHNIKVHSAAYFTDAKFNSTENEVEMLEKYVTGRKMKLKINLHQT